jgi:ABC-type sugar transport system ATPase subunit
VSILFDNISLRAGEFELDGLSLDIATGSYAVLMGRTGCGKTTLIETLCGLRPLVKGRILLDGTDVSALRPADRGIGYVPQDGALFPTMTVRDHIAFPLQIRKQTTRAIASRVDELAKLLGLTHLLERLPMGLSGGERQRTALGRALSFHPRVLLLDEPLSALDDETREEVHGVLSEINRHTSVTTLHVTHNRTDADALADVVHILSPTGIETRSSR